MMSKEDTHGDQEAQGDQGISCNSAEPVVKRVPFAELSEGETSVLIGCGDAIYTLRRTRSGGLVLNK